MAQRPATPFHHYICKVAPPPLDKQGLSTSDTVRNELFASLELYSEVKAIGRKLLSDNGHTNVSKGFPQFQSYLRQGRAFFKAGEILEYRASPLSYYYAFMNFAKAYIFVRDTNFQDEGLHHGLMATFGTASIKRQFVKARQHGVLPKFYRQIMNASLASGAEFSVATLLGYISDVTFEYGQFKLGAARTKRGKVAFVGNTQTGQSRAVLALYRHSNRHAPTILEQSARFASVTINEIAAHEMFGLKAEESRVVDFYETTTPHPISAQGGIAMQAIVADILSSLGNSLSLCPFNDDFRIEVNAVMNTPKKTAMNEVLAIYIIMFHLGSLVRYRPWVLEKMLSTKDAWIVERFVKAAPLTFLRHIRNMIDGQYLAYGLR